MGYTSEVDETKLDVGYTSEVDDTEVDVTGHTVVVTGMVSVVTWGVPGQFVTVGPHEVTVYSVVV